MITKVLPLASIITGCIYISPTVRGILLRLLTQAATRWYNTSTMRGVTTMSSEEYKKYGYNRSLESYLVEWRIHNIAYYLGFMKDHYDEKKK